MKDNLMLQMVAYTQRHPEESVAILSRPEPDQAAGQQHIWEQWQAYLDRKGHKSTLAWMRRHLAGGKGLSLPCANPAAFDAAYAREYSPRNRYWDK